MQTIDDATTGYQRGDANASQILPNVGVWYTFSPASRWLLHGRVDWISADIGKYDGTLWNTNLGVNFQAWRHVGFDLSYPPEVLEFICTESAPFSNDLIQIHANQIANGVIRAGGYCKKPVSVNSENTLINLVFKVRKNSGSPSSLQMINKFADFPYLLCSIDQRLQTLET